MAKRIIDLTETTVVGDDVYIEVDKAAYSESRQMSLKTLLRSKETYVQNEAGNATAVANFTSREAIQITIDQDCTITVTGLTDEDEVWLKVIKGANDIVSFYGAGGEYSENTVQSGLTELVYVIRRYNTTADDTVTIKPIKTQLSDNAITITPAIGTVTLKSYFESTINDNICYFEGRFTYNAGGAATGLAATLSGWSVTKDNSGIIACSAYVVNGGSSYAANAAISTTSLGVSWYTSLSGDMEVYINGHFKVT